MDAPRWQPTHRPLRAVLRELIRVAFLVLARLRIEGLENLPDRGPLLVVANHFHFVDPVAVIRAMPWPLEFIGGTQLPNAPTGVKWLTSLWGTTRVRRGGSSREALRTAEAVLKGDGVFGIFPEGGSWAAVLRPARPGAAYLAARTGVPVLPIGLDGLTDLFSSLRHFRRASVTIRIGQPFGPFETAPRGREGREAIDRIGETMMQRIAELIPAERRGVYSEDAAVREAARTEAAYPWATGREREEGGRT